MHGMKKLEENYIRRFRNAGVMITSDTLMLETMHLDVEYFDDNYDGLGNLKGRGVGEMTADVVISEHGATQFAPDGFAPPVRTPIFVPFLMGVTVGVVLTNVLGLL